MANLMINLSFIHIVEEIFFNLDYAQLKTCMDVNNESWKVIFKNPSFWLTYWKPPVRRANPKDTHRGSQPQALQATSERSEIDFTPLNLAVKNRNFSVVKALVSSMKNSCENELETELNFLIGTAIYNEDSEIAEALAPFYDDPKASWNSPNRGKKTTHKCAK